MDEGVRTGVRVGLSRQRMDRLAGMLRHLDAAQVAGTTSKQPGEIRAGVIGLDGDGVTIAKLLSRSSSSSSTGCTCRVVAAYDRGIYPRGSSVHSTVPHGMHGTIRSLVERVPQNIREMEALGVPMVETIQELLGQVDFVFLMTRDGRPRLEQAAEVSRHQRCVLTLICRVTAALRCAGVAREKTTVHGSPCRIQPR